MNTHTTKKHLTTIGLKPGEITVYIHCLEHAWSTVSSIAKGTGIPRTTVALHLKQLLAMQLIHITISARQKRYIANPIDETLDQLLKREMQKTENITNSIECLRDAMTAVGHVQPRSNTTVYVYKGSAGIKELFRVAHAEKQPLYWMGSFGVYINLLPEEDLFRNFTIPWMENEVASIGITDKLIKEYPRFVHKTKLVKYKYIRFPDDMGAQIAAVGDLVGFVKRDGGKSEAVLFRDKQYADLIRFMIKMLWEKL